MIVGVQYGPTEVRWEARHTAFEEGRGFRDEMLSGPFAQWTHTHRFLDGEDGGCIVEDEGGWEAPLGAAGSFLGDSFIKGELERAFAFRHGSIMRSVRDTPRRFASAFKATNSASVTRTHIIRSCLSAGSFGGRPILARFVRFSRMPSVYFT